MVHTPSIAAPPPRVKRAAGMTFTFSPATEEQTISRATAKGDIPHPAHASSYRHDPVTVPEKPAPPNRCTCTITKSMPGASRAYKGIRFTVE